MESFIEVLNEDPVRWATHFNGPDQICARLAEMSHGNQSVSEAVVVVARLSCQHVIILTLGMREVSLEVTG